MTTINVPLRTTTKIVATVLDADGNEVRRHEDCNLVLDTFYDALNELGASSITYRMLYRAFSVQSNHIGGAIQVGTGTTPPANSDTALETPTYTLVASTSNFSRLVNDITVDSPNNQYTYSWGARYTFPLGAINANLTELGLATNAGELMTRALFTDELGSPAPLSVSSNEQLVITYYVNFVDVPLSYVIPATVDGTNYTITIGRYAVMPTNPGENDTTPAHALFNGRTRSRLYYRKDADAVTSIPYAYNSNPFGDGPIEARAFDDISDSNLTPTSTSGVRLRFRANTNDLPTDNGYIAWIGDDDFPSGDMAFGHGIYFDPPLPKSELQLLEMEIQTVFSRPAP